MPLGDSPSVEIRLDLAYQVYLDIVRAARMITVLFVFLFYTFSECHMLWESTCFLSGTTKFDYGAGEALLYTIPF